MLLMSVTADTLGPS